MDTPLSEMTKPFPETTVTACIYCGKPSRVRQCFECSAWFAERFGKARREVLREWAELKANEHAAAHPYEVLLRLEGSAAEYAWGQFKSMERAHTAGWDALHPLKPGDKPYGKRCVSFRVVDLRTGTSVERAQIESQVA